MKANGGGRRPRAAVSWSSGKDSAYAMYSAVKSGKYDVVALLTTVTSSYERVSMHGVRESLLMEQTKKAGLPLIKAVIPPKSTNEEYDKAMSKAIEEMKQLGIEYLIFGDIFLEDVREYREKRMERTGIKPVFPLWGRNTKELASEIINAGIYAEIVCLDPKKLDREFGGSPFDSELLDSLPDSVDPCGENGEFHTFVLKAPFFSEDIPVAKGNSVERDGFLFTDLFLQ